MTTQCDEVRKTLTVKNALGLHLRPAALLAQLVGGFESEVFIEHDGEQVNCRSALSLMMLSAGNGTTLAFVARGRDALTVMEEIESLFSQGFGED